MSVFLDPVSLFTFALVGSAHAQPARPAGFLSVIDDIPIPDGLVEQPDSITDFDGPSGRIVSAEARGPLRATDVAGFYDATLPALGWRRDGAAWLRGRGKLTIAIAEADVGLVVTYRLIERPASLGLD